MGYLPVGGFLHLATSKNLTVTVLKRVICDFCARYGDIQPSFNDVLMEKCAEEWQAEIFDWTERYQEDFSAWNGGDASNETLSHIKYAGTLLRAYTQIGMEGVEAAAVGGLLPEKTKDLIEARPNEFLMFAAVFWLFNEQQYQRADAKLNYDVENPPMNPRYMRAMTHYLHAGGNGSNDETCRNSDLYMVFKAMDLFGASSGDAA